MMVKGGSGHHEAKGYGRADGTPFGEAEKHEVSEEAG